MNGNSAAPPLNLCPIKLESIAASSPKSDAFNHRLSGNGSAQWDDSAKTRMTEGI